jgi:hypothetical protein
MGSRKKTPASNSELRKVQDEIQRSARAGMKPVLVFGSGLLRHLNFGPLADWTCLLHEVASQLRIPHDERMAKSFPTLYWERILVEAASRSRTQASECESRARRHICEIIGRATDRLEVDDLGALALHPHIRSIITLNFTPVPFAPAQGWKLRRGPIPSLTNGDHTIWCPHGHYDEPKSIRLGARQYGLLIGDLERRRKAYRQTVRIHSSRRSANNALPERDFVTDVLTCPLIFAGCGLQAAEWTLWWLLATKSRDSARQARCDSVYVTADEVDPSLVRMLTSMRCRILRTSSREEVWSTVSTLIPRASRTTPPKRSNARARAS